MAGKNACPTTARCGSTGLFNRACLSPIFPARGPAREKETIVIRIGILGTDNSHSEAFSRLLNVKGEKPHVPGARVVALFGLDDKINRQRAEAGNVPTIVDRPRDMLGMVDAVIVDFRHGALHYKYAKPFIEAGIPTFIDKPMSISVAHAKAMVALARKKRVPITSFSTVRLGPPVENMKKAMKKIGRVRGGIVTGPGSSKSEYAGVFFYGVHCVELMLEAFGNRVASVRAADYDGSVIATVGYRNGAVVTLNIIDGARPPFDAIAFGAKGVARYDRPGSFGGYYYGMKKLLKLIWIGKPPIPYNDLILSVRILNAIQKSIDAGGKLIRI
jgi:predicted dehydrogenase